MNEKNTGGSAFPSLNAEMTGIDSEGNERFSVEPSGGMNLRDYFAAKAMQAMIGTAAAPCMGGLDGYEENMSRAAYTISDAMLTERAR